MLLFEVCFSYISPDSFVFPSFLCFPADDVSFLVYLEHLYTVSDVHLGLGCSFHCALR